MKRFVLLFALSLPAFAASDVPQSVTELWSDFDPRKDPLETEIIREWKEDGGVFCHVRYLVGTFKGKTARMAAIYGFPEGGGQNHGGQNHANKTHDFAKKKNKLPAVMHIHGGGQRGSLSEVKMLVARGYATLSVNWGGSGTGKPPFNSVEGAKPGDPNTDWGGVDPTQLNVQGYSSMLPGPKQFFEDREHPKNCNWYLLTVGCRRGLTFLEQQPEVDAQRLGVHGYSMGGNLTMYVAGTDSRVKAAVPGVGGQGWRWQPHPFIGGVAQQEHIKGDVEVFRRTLSFESYAPLIRCPVMHRSASNDFHGWMDDVYRTDALIEGQPVRHAWSVHFNHRLTPEVAVTMPVWFDHFLKGGPALPETPASELVLKAEDGIPQLRVTATQPRNADTPVRAVDGPSNSADRSVRVTWAIARCDIYYSVDPDPRARFWRSAEVARDGDVFTAKLPLHALDSALFAFANVYYTLPQPESLRHLPGYEKPISELCLSTLLHRATLDDLRVANIRVTDQASKLLDDFARDWRDWYRHNVGNRDHWQNWTRKVTDPKWRGPDGAKLAVTLKLDETNRIAFVVVENEWRNYRGPKKTFVCEKEIPGAPADQTVLLDAADFKSTVAGAPLKSWSQLDLLGICAHYEEKGQPSKPVRWRGPTPEFKRLKWR
ncbi:MAG: dienelactone hydrolase family protein [Verrucomicrobia bacterium]|nr:dienelactone hydrolase family protein [Verrucomicrobiota bacterium]